MFKTKLIVLLLFIAIRVDAQQDTTIHDSVAHIDPLDVAMDFILDLSDEEVATDIVLSQYVEVNSKDDEMLDYLIASLEEIRLNLMSKNIDDIEYINYLDMPKKEVRDIDPEDKNVENMYFLKYGKRLITSLYIENGKIRSFTLVSKGEQMAHFVTY